MVSYFKTQWFNLVMALLAVIAIIVNMVQGDELLTLAWAVSFAYWMLMSFIDFNSEKIRMLEAKAKKYDALVKEVDALRELQKTSDKLTDQRLKKLEGRR
jgi:hypothetical protein